MSDLKTPYQTCGRCPDYPVTSQTCCGKMVGLKFKGPSEDGVLEHHFPRFHHRVLIFASVVDHLSSHHPSIQCLRSARHLISSNQQKGFSKSITSLMLVHSVGGLSVFKSKCWILVSLKSRAELTAINWQTDWTHQRMSSGLKGLHRLF